MLIYLTERITYRMSLKGKGRVLKVGAGKTACVTIPAAMTRDSNFPFEVPEDVCVRIESGRLIVEKQKT